LAGRDREAGIGAEAAAAGAALPKPQTVVGERAPGVIGDALRVWKRAIPRMELLCSAHFGTSELSATNLTHPKDGFWVQRTQNRT